MAVAWHECMQPLGLLRSLMTEWHTALVHFGKICHSSSSSASKALIPQERTHTHKHTPDSASVHTISSPLAAPVSALCQTANMGDHYRSISGGRDDGDDGSRGFFRFPGVHSVGSDMAQEYLHRVCLYFTTYGVAFVLVGALCILLPLVFVGLSIPHLIAWILIIGGAAALLHFLLIFGAPGTTSFLLLGLVHLAVGLWLLFQRSVRRGSSFVWLLFGWFFIHGLLKLLMGYEVRSLKSWPALAGSGSIAIILAILNVALAGAYGFRLVCVLFGIDLAVTGISFLLVSIMAYYANRAAERNPLLGDA